LEALRGAGQIGIYRQQPQWARGHLQTLNLGAGESLDFEMLDQLQRYWGGGVYAFRPMNRGRFAGSTRSVQFDGPTLYQGKPHPKDPNRRAPVTPDVLPQHAPQYQGGPYHPAQYGGGYEPHGYGAPGVPQASPELRMLGGLVERMMSRLDSMEAKLAGPGAAPAQAPDQIAGVLQTLKLAKQINEMMNPQAEYDDEEEEGAEWTPKNPQEAMMQMAMRKLDEDPEALSSFFGNKQQAPQNGQPPPPQAATGGPRLVRPGAPQAGAPGGIEPGQLVAHLQQLDPAARAQLVNEIGKSLDPETLQQLMGLMSGPDSAAG